MTIVDYPAMPAKPEAPLSARLKYLDVTVSTKVSTLAYGVDESYNLQVTTSKATLQANTIFGALRGLETFAQLVTWNGTVMLVPYTPITVTDAPAWQWRGMLIDTSRHFQSVSNLEQIIDSMAYAKLNVFHWHLTDAESFPISLPSAPEFASKGAWNSKAVYTQKDVKHIINYAAYRGIRVIPEIDTPGHTYSFGKSHPEMITDCSNVISRSAGYPGINNVPLNLTNSDIYPLLDKIYGDVSSMFSDDYVHIGGDEVNPRCWDEFPAIKQWMGEHGMDNTTYLPLIRDFRLKLTPMLTSRNKKMVLWQEALEEMLPLGAQNPLSPSNTIVHVWKNAEYQDAIKTSLKHGYPTLLSAGWYLDQQIPKPNAYTDDDEEFIFANATHYLDIDTWKDMYLIDPISTLGLNETERALFLGGEIAQWGEAVMGIGILTNIWPRAAAGAERLWVGSTHLSASDVDAAYHRLIRYQCYLYQRGVPASGLRPSYCTSDVFDPPRVAGGLTIKMPVWALIILLAAMVALIVVSIVLGVKLFQTNKKLPSESGFGQLGEEDLSH